MLQAYTYNGIGVDVVVVEAVFSDGVAIDVPDGLDVSGPTVLRSCKGLSMGEFADLLEP